MCRPSTLISHPETGSSFLSWSHTSLLWSILGWPHTRTRSLVFPGQSFFYLRTPYKLPFHFQNSNFGRYMMWTPQAWAMSLDTHLRPPFLFLCHHTSQLQSWETASGSLDTTCYFTLLFNDFRASLRSVTLFTAIFMPCGVCLLIWLLVPWKWRLFWLHPLH